LRDDRHRSGRKTLAQRAKSGDLEVKAHLLGQRPARLIILGQGEEEAALRQLIDDLGIAEHVDLVGFQKNPFSWMRRCDLYVMSSAWEGLPGTLIEALACGAKVVSTDCRTGPREILEDGKWGTLVPVGDADALAVAIGDALDADANINPQERTCAFESTGIVTSYSRLLL
ncbi:MAG: glycosyltransferase, partial [Alphaproteobacteria bacterium]